MTDIVIIAVSVCASAYFCLHIFRQVCKALDGRRRRDELEQVSRELDDEILNGGNIARIAQLRKRMRELAD